MDRDRALLLGAMRGNFDVDRALSLVAHDAELEFLAGRVRRQDPHGVAHVLRVAPVDALDHVTFLELERSRLWRLNDEQSAVRAEIAAQPFVEFDEFEVSEPPCVSPARTWLQRVGWRRHGLIPAKAA